MPCYDPHPSTNEVETFDARNTIPTVVKSADPCKLKRCNLVDLAPRGSMRRVLGSNPCDRRELPQGIWVREC